MAGCVHGCLGKWVRAERTRGAAGFRYNAAALTGWQRQPFGHRVPSARLLLTLPHLLNGFRVDPGGPRLGSIARSMQTRLGSFIPSPGETPTASLAPRTRRASSRLIRPRKSRNKRSIGGKRRGGIPPRQGYVLSPLLFIFSFSFPARFCARIFCSSCVDLS